jgi:hypothetical protein
LIFEACKPSLSIQNNLLSPYVPQGDQSTSLPRKEFAPDRFSLEFDTMNVDRTVLEKAAALLELEYNLPIRQELRTLLDNEEREGQPRDWSIILSTMSGGVMAQVLLHVGRRFYSILKTLEAANLSEGEKIAFLTRSLHEEFVVPAKQFGATIHAIILALIKAHFKKD